MAMNISITNLLNREKARTSLLNETQLEEVETKLTEMDIVLGVLPYKAVPQQLQFKLCNDLNIREYFFESRAYADAFGTAASFAKEYITKNRKTKNKDGDWIRKTKDVPEVPEFTKNFAASTNYWVSYASDNQRAEEQVMSGLIQGMDATFKMNEANRDIHWNLCLERIVDVMNDAPERLMKTKASVESLFHRFHTRLRSEYTSVIRLLENIAHDEAYCDILEYEAGQTIEEIEQVAKFNINELSNLFEGFELSDVVEEGDGLEDFNPEQLTETDYSETDAEGNLLDLASPELNSDNIGLRD